MTTESLSHSLLAVYLIPAEQCHGIYPSAVILSVFAIILSVFANLHSGDADLQFESELFTKSNKREDLFAVVFREDNLLKTRFSYGAKLNLLRSVCST